MKIRIAKQWRSVNAEDKRCDVSRKSSVLLTLKMKTWIAKQRRSVNAEDEEMHHRLMDSVLLTLTHLAAAAASPKDLFHSARQLPA